jgi:RNA polymerase sigma factor (sigma-70 family)
MPTARADFARLRPPFSTLNQRRGAEEQRFKKNPRPLQARGTGKLFEQAEALDMHSGSKAVALSWDGRDALGARCDTGSYALRVSAPGLKLEHPLALVRPGITEIEAHDGPAPGPDEFSADLDLRRSSRCYNALSVKALVDPCNEGKGSEGGDPAIALLRRWQEEGDLDALDELLRQEVGLLKSRLRGKGMRVTGDPVSLSDIAQETVLRFLEVNTAPHFDSPQKLRAYLWTAAWRLLVQRLQKTDHRALRIDEMESWNLAGGLSTSSGLGAVDENERSIALDLALNLLRPAEREVLRLVYLEHLGIEGAAEKLGIGRDAANTRLVRARRELAKRLCRWEETIGA